MAGLHRAAGGERVGAATRWYRATELSRQAESAAARRLCPTVGTLGGERGGEAVAGIHRVAGGDRGGAVMPNGVASVAGASREERGAAAPSGGCGSNQGRRAESVAVW